MPEPLTDAGAPSNAFMDLTPRLVRTETANPTSCRFPALHLLYLAQLICDAIDFIQTRVPGFPALREGTISGRSGCEGSHPLGWQPGDPYSILILILTCWSVPPPLLTRSEVVGYLGCAGQQNNRSARIGAHHCPAWARTVYLLRSAR